MKRSVPFLSLLLCACAAVFTPAPALGAESVKPESETEMEMNAEHQQFERSAGLRMTAGRISSNVFAIPSEAAYLEAYFRLGMAGHKRLYVSFGWQPISISMIDGEDWGMDLIESELQFAGFMEWSAGGRVFSVHGGPGCVLALGFYSYEYYGRDKHEARSSFGPGADIGIQGGAEARLGRVVIGADVRLAYCARFWDKGSKFGVAFVAGGGIGFIF